MKYEWTDLFPFAQTYWDYNEPNENNIPSSPNKACVSLNLPYGNWGVVSTCSNRLAYVCKTNMDNVPNPNDIADLRGDPLGQSSELHF